MESYINNHEGYVKAQNLNEENGAIKEQMEEQDDDEEEPIE